ncbi:MAG: AraC family transcriptional regulator [Lactococcus chungangensis]
MKGLKELKEYFDDETFLEKLIKFDDIPFIVYHDYNKDKIFELKNNHPILLDSNFFENWYSHYKNLRQNFFFIENEVILFRGYYDLIYSTFPVQQTDATTLSGAFVFGGLRSKTSQNQTHKFHKIPIFEDQIIKKKCSKIYYYLSKHLHLQTLYLSIKNEIHKHLSENPTPEDISNRLKISQRKIKSEILNHTNLTFSNFVSKLKIEYACHQLQYTDKSLQDISNSIGFMNTSSFVRFFKRKTSQTPLAYRNHNQK